MQQEPEQQQIELELPEGEVDIHEADVDNSIKAEDAEIVEEKYPESKVDRATSSQADIDYFDGMKKIRKKRVSK